VVGKGAIPVAFCLKTTPLVRFLVLFTMSDLAAIMREEMRWMAANMAAEKCRNELNARFDISVIQVVPVLVIPGEKKVITTELPVESSASPNASLPIVDVGDFDHTEASTPISSGSVVAATFPPTTISLVTSSSSRSWPLASSTYRPSLDVLMTRL
jgi:hypothetical protein